MDRRNRIVDSKFDLAGRVAVITGGAGLLGYQHARAIAGAGGIPVLADLCGPFAQEKAECIQEEFGVDALGYGTDITREGEVGQLLDEVLGAGAGWISWSIMRPITPKWRIRLRSNLCDSKTFRSTRGKRMSTSGSPGPSCAARS